MLSLCLAQWFFEIGVLIEFHAIPFVSKQKKWHYNFRGTFLLNEISILIYVSRLNRRRQNNLELGKYTTGSLNQRKDNVLK